MKLVFLMWLAFIGTALAGTDNISSSSLKDQAKFEDDIHTYNHRKKDNLLLDYRARLDVLEYKHQESESKYNDLKLKYDALKANEYEVFSSAKETRLIVLDSAKQLTELSSRHIVLKANLDQLVNSNSNSNSNNNEGIKFEVWTGLLLACVAILVTALGVGIALLAFWGYKNIKDASVKASLNESELMINQAIQTGEFNDVIYAAVERVVYRGILSDEDFPEESNDEME